MFNLWKLKQWTRWALVAPVLVLAGCGGLNSVGVRPDPLPINVAMPSPHPIDVINGVNGVTVGDDEVRIGRLGDALLECRSEKILAVDAYNKLRDALIASG